MSSANPPVADVSSHEMEHHGQVRVDDYYWMRNRDDRRVIAYLEAENAYTESVMAHTEELREKLFEEIKGRIRQTDETVPYKLGDYYYYSRFEEGREYSVHCRKHLSLENPEEVMLDGNELARGHDYFSLVSLRISSGQNLLAYAVDTVGRRIHTLRVKDLSTGETLPDVVPEMTGNLVWAGDSTVFYSKQDPSTLRSHRIYRHRIGTDASEDVLVYEETDETFRTFVYLTKSRKYVMIAAAQTVSTEHRFLDVSNPTGEFTLIEPRRRDHKYSVDHHLGDHFYIRTNHGARNFQLKRAPISDPGEENWEVVVGHREDVLLEDFELLRDYLVVAERHDGLVRIWARRWSSGDEREIDFAEPAYFAKLLNNTQIETDFLRYEYTSLTTPPTVYDHNLATGEETLLKREEVLGRFDPADYRTERLHAVSADGVEVPISLVYRKDDAARDGERPLLLSAYGSYGISRNATFVSPRLSLLDRGFAFAIAHIRGGEDLGRSWYEEGKLLKKANSFNDFIACAEHLVAEGYADPKRLYAHGGSAGGLLMGVVVNKRPDLFHGVIAAVPFVDVVTTMLDESIPLTTFEYDEWGDPRKKEFFDYILAYSPYDNVGPKDYPHLLVTAGLHDSQVQYWEPAKWVAKLRKLKTDGNRLLLKTELGAGHAGPSGRSERYRETAFLYAFLLDLAGIST